MRKSVKLVLVDLNELPYVVAKQPIMKNKIFKTNKSKFENSDYIMKNGMLVGCHPKLENSDLDYICQSLIEFFNAK